MKVKRGQLLMYNTKYVRPYEYLELITKKDNNTNIFTVACVSGEKFELIGFTRILHYQESNTVKQMRNTQIIPLDNTQTNR